MFQHSSTGKISTVWSQEMEMVNFLPQDKEKTFERKEKFVLKSPWVKLAGCMLLITIKSEEEGVSSLSVAPVTPVASGSPAPAVTVPKAVCLTHCWLESLRSINCTDYCKTFCIQTQFGWKECHTLGIHGFWIEIRECRPQIQSFEYGSAFSPRAIDNCSILFFVEAEKNYESAKQDIANSKILFDSLQSQYSQLQKQHSNTESSQTETANEIARLKMEKEGLEEMVESLKQSRVSSDSNKEATFEDLLKIDELTKKNIQLENEKRCILQEGDKSREQLRVITSELATIKQNTQIESNNLQVTIAELKQRIAELELYKKDDTTGADSEIQYLNNEIKKLRDSNTQLQLDIEKRDSDILVLRDEKQSLTHELTFRDQKENQIRIEMQIAEETKHKMQKLVDEAKQDMKEVVMKATMAQQVVEEKEKEVKIAVNEASQLKSEISSLKQQIDKSNTEIVELKVQASTAGSSSSADKASIKKTIADAQRKETQILEQQEQIKKLTKSLEMMKETLKQTEGETKAFKQNQSKADDNVKEREEQIVELTANLRKLSAQKAEWETLAKKYQEEQKKSQNELYSLQSANTQLTKIQKDYKILHEETHELNEMKLDLEKRLRAAQTDIVTRNTENARNIQEITKLKLDLTQLRTALDISEQKSLKQTIEKLTAQVDYERKQSEKLTRELQEMRRRVQKLIDEGKNEQGKKSLLDKQKIYGNPCEALKRASNLVVQHFEDNVKPSDKKENLQFYGNTGLHPELTIILDSQLCESLLAIVNNGFTSTGWFGKYSVWDMISEIAQLDHEMDDGIKFQQAWEFVSEIAYLFNKRQSVSIIKLDLDDLKFRLFVLHALK